MLLGFLDRVFWVTAPAMLRAWVLTRGSTVDFCFTFLPSDALPWEHLAFVRKPVDCFVLLRRVSMIAFEKA